MSNANRDYAIVYDVKNSSLTLSRPLVFYITDKNTSNIFVKLVTRVSIGNEIDRYTNIENASNYALTMRVIKPSNEVKSIEATQHEEESVFQFDLTEDFKDMPGKYTCELTISTIVSSRQELITSDPFSYEVKRSILSNVGEIIETEDTTVEKLLNDLNATKAELSSQIKQIKKYCNVTNLNLLDYNISENDDISGIINDINNDCVTNNKRVNIIIPFNCKLNNKIIIDCNYVSLKGDKVIIDTSGITDTVCVEITSKVSAPYSAPKILIDGVSFNDNSPNSKDTKTGLLFKSSNGEVAHLIIQNCSISGYKIAENFGNNAYIIKHINTNLYNCATLISAPNREPVNNGENINYHSCSFFNSGLVVNNNFGDCDFNFINCSFDYNASIFINKGKINCNNCHFENKDLGEIQFVNEGFGATYINNSFLIFHFPENQNAQNNYISSTTKNAFLSIKDSYISGTLNIYNTFNTGEGNVLLKNIHAANSYVNNTRVDNKYNIMIDGDFTSSSIVDNISITKDTSVIENRFSGANCTLALENELLTVTKQWGAGSDCAFSFYFDIDYGEWFDCDFTCKADANMTGQLYVNIYFANVKYFENGLHQVNKKELVSTTSFFLDHLNDFSKIIFPNKAKNINKIYNSVIVEFDMYYIVGSNNKFYIDNFFANTY